MPTARAIELAAPVAEFWRGCGASSRPPSRSIRRLHAPLHDRRARRRLGRVPAAAARRAAAGGARHRHQRAAASAAPGDAPERAWRAAFAELEARAMDIAVVPFDDIPARFHTHPLYEEDFVVAMRAGHPFAEDSDAGAYCAVQHLVVSLSGDPMASSMSSSRRTGSRADRADRPELPVRARHRRRDRPGRRRCRGASWPPRPRFGVGMRGGAVAARPFPPQRGRAQAAMLDAGIAWLLDLLASAA